MNRLHLPAPTSLRRLTLALGVLAWTLLLHQPQALFAESKTNSTPVKVSAAGSVASNAAHPAALPVFNHGVLLWSHPAGWEYTPPRIDVSGKTPMNFRLQGPKGRPTVLVTVFWDGFGTNNSKPNLEALEARMTDAASNQFLPGSIEKKVTVCKFDSTTIQFRYSTFTDSEWVGKPVPELESRHATLGTFRTGTLWGNFMLMSNDTDGPEFRSGLEVLQSFHMAP